MSENGKGMGIGGGGWDLVGVGMDNCLLLSGGGQYAIDNHLQICK